MISRHKQLLSSYERVQDFLSANPLATLPAKYAERRAELDALVTRLRSLVMDQTAGQRESRDDTVRQDAERKSLRENHLAPISRIAKVALPNEKSIQKAFAMPATNAPTQQMIADAEAMRDTAKKYEQVFLENGCPADFLEQLDAAVAALRESVLGRARNVGRHVGAKEGLKQTLADGRRCLQMLDAMVLRGFSGDRQQIAKWRLAKRVQDVPGPSFRATGGTADENLPPAAPAVPAVPAPAVPTAA